MEKIVLSWKVLQTYKKLMKVHEARLKDCRRVNVVSYGVKTRITIQNIYSVEVDILSERDSIFDNLYVIYDINAEVYSYYTSKIVEDRLTIMKLPGHIFVRSSVPVRFIERDYQALITLFLIRSRDGNFLSDLPKDMFNEILTYL